MFRAVATMALTIALMGAALAVGAASQMTDEMTSKSTSESAAAREASAKERARLALAQHLGVAPDSIEVTRLEPRTWSDSSMGCGKPGTMALTVITEGYAVSLRAQNRAHEVHVSDAGAIVCGKAAPIRRDPSGSANARGLDVMMERARQDLAQRLGVDAATIRLDGMRAYRWPDSTLDCPRADEPIRPGPIDGFILSLKHAGRSYTYHTDRQQVRACPAIESQ